MDQFMETDIPHSCANDTHTHQKKSIDLIQKESEEQIHQISVEVFHFVDLLKFHHITKNFFPGENKLYTSPCETCFQYVSRYILSQHFFGAFSYIYTYLIVVVQSILRNGLQTLVKLPSLTPS